MDVVKRVKRNCSAVNIPLLKLKLSYFFYYFAWYATQPYCSVMQAQIVSYHHLAIIFAWSPVATLGGSVLSGFISDKLGNYKIITIFGVIMSGAAPFGILWLYYEHKEYQSLGLYNSTVENTTMIDSLQLTNPAERPYTYPMMVILLMMGVFSATSNTTLLDATALSMSKKHGADFARQKLWGFPAMVLSPFLCGVLVEQISKYLGYEDDLAAFVVGAVSTIIAVPLLAQLNIDVEKNDKSIVATLKYIMGMADFSVFILVEIITGMCYAFHSIYRPVFATELQASKTLIGLLLSASGVGTTLVLSIIKIVVGKLGEPNTLVISLMLYCIRFVVFYYLHNPLLLLLTEIIDGFCGFTAMIAGSYYAAAEAPPGMLASFNGVLFAAILATGRALGTGIGSKLIGLYGIRTTYLIGAYLVGGTAITYFFINHFFLRQIREKRHQKLKKESKEVYGIENPTVELKEENVAA